MVGDPISSVPPAIARLAKAFTRTGWISIWCQGVLGVIAGVVLLLALFQFAVTGSGGRNPGTGAGIFLTVLGLLTAVGGMFWALRYTRFARRLRSPDGAKRPKPKDTVQLLTWSLWTTLGGMALSLLGSGSIVGALIGKFLFQPQGVAVLGSDSELSRFVQPMDVFIVQANLNILLAHFAGLLCTLWLLRIVSRV